MRIYCLAYQNAIEVATANQIWYGTNAKPSVRDTRNEITSSGRVNAEASTSATADAISECRLKNNHAHDSAAATLSVRQINQTSWCVLERRLATTQVAMISNAKL